MSRSTRYNSDVDADPSRLWLHHSPFILGEADSQSDSSFEEGLVEQALREENFVTDLVKLAELSDMAKHGDHRKAQSEPPSVCLDLSMGCSVMPTENSLPQDLDVEHYTPCVDTCVEPSEGIMSRSGFAEMD